MRRRNIIFLTILLITIGFAGVATNLVLNGTLNIGFNREDYENNVIFIKTKTDGVASISEDGKSITYTAKSLTTVNEETSLTFWIKNKSTQYDADAVIECGQDETSTLGNKVTITVEPTEYHLQSNEVKIGELKVKLNSSVTEDETGTFTCRLVASPSSREETGVITPEPYEDEFLKGTDPVINKDLVPIILANDGTVTYADISEKWYDYENKEWANAIILVDSPSQTYNTGDIIKESDIESYFVWIPRYRYKLFHTNQADGVEAKLSESIAHEIEIEFESKDIPVSEGSQDGEWLTHPAFTNFDVNGIWVGKFKTGYKGATSASGAQQSNVDSNNIIVKPNVYSWRNNTVGNFFKAMYNYNRELDSHMMKNTEWGAVAYLSHSKYGVNTEVRINNNSNYLTGYAANTKDASGSATNNQPWNTETGYLASTTGNITGVYDMNGGGWEYVAGYRDNTSNSSGLTTVEITETYKGYIDIYPSDSAVTTYSKRILGDATGEMGPFYSSGGYYYNNWYNDYSRFVESSYPWFNRGGNYSIASGAGNFNFDRSAGAGSNNGSARLVLLG